MKLISIGQNVADLQMVYKTRAVELSENILQNLFHNLTTQTVVPSVFFSSLE